MEKILIVSDNFGSCSATIDNFLKSIGIEHRHLISRSIPKNKLFHTIIDTYTDDVTHILYIGSNISVVEGINVILKDTLKKFVVISGVKMKDVTPNEKLVIVKDKGYRDLFYTVLLSTIINEPNVKIGMYPKPKFFKRLYGVEPSKMYNLQHTRGSKDIIVHELNKFSELVFGVNFSETRYLQFYIFGTDCMLIYTPTVTYIFGCGVSVKYGTEEFEKDMFKKINSFVGTLEQIILNDGFNNLSGWYTSRNTVVAEIIDCFGLVYGKTTYTYTFVEFVFKNKVVRVVINRERIEVRCCDKTVRLLVGEDIIETILEITSDEKE